VIDGFVLSAIHSQRAGFDGVEIQGGHGHLIQEFISGFSNHRTDEYGGSPENRTRFMREVLEALIDVWGADRVGIRLSPNGDSQGTDDSNPAATFGAAAKVCEELGLAFVELREPGPEGTFGRTDVPKQSPLIRQIYTGTLILNSDYTAEEAVADVTSGKCDAVSFGRPYISNPDLDKRIAAGAHWNPNKDVPKSWYFPIPEGYVDYPTLEEEQAEAAE
jgi:2,4-dienoyl-CoA reductase-like NADH-dependent reductase (Old Yellow Enzyme family)